MKGTPGHGSMPYKTDNALVKAAEIVRRIEAFRPETQIHDVWRQFISSMGYPAAAHRENEKSPPRPENSVFASACCGCDASPG